MKVDLHIHTQYSMGNYQIQEVIEQAMERGVTHLSITDVATVAAYHDPLIRLTGKMGVTLIPGIELIGTTETGPLHFLGIGIDPFCGPIEAYCQWKAMNPDAEELEAPAIIQLIHQAGGLAILAHPSRYRQKLPLSDLLAEGLDGIEVFYAKHDVKATNKWLQFAKLAEVKMAVGSGCKGGAASERARLGTVLYDTRYVHPWLEEWLAFE